MLNGQLEKNVALLGNLIVLLLKGFLVIKPAKIPTPCDKYLLTTWLLLPHFCNINVTWFYKDVCVTTTETL